MELIPDRSWRRPGCGRVVLAGSPLRLFRLTESGVRVAEAVEQGRPLPAGHEPLTSRWLDAGAVHPRVTAALPRASARAAGPADATAAPVADVAVVVPAHGEPTAGLAAVVAALAAAPLVAEVIVVDDASEPPLPPIAGARTVRLDVNAGPGGARAAGIAATAAPFVLCVDADVSIDDGPALVSLLRQHLDDDRVGLAAPRVRAAAAPGALAAFEAARSPLDLGAEPARIRPLTRVSYVPAAVVMLRREALDAVGGFDPALRWGEDVDLVWRLDEAGWVCRYEPAAVAHHAVRPTVRTWLDQRRRYGTSAAPLARRHGEAVAPLRTSGWSAGSWGLAAAGHPVLGAGLAAGTTVAFARRLGDVPERTAVAIRYAGLGNLHAGRLIAAALTRTWWPLTLAAALVSRRARRVAVAAVLAPALIEWATSRPRLDPLRYVALRMLDDAAYGLGVWQGCWSERDLHALTPSLIAG